jgi:hypothetical protein
MVGCDVCDGWFHYDCVGMTEAVADSMNHWSCPACIQEWNGGAPDIVRDMDMS